jgi:branched-chain amino acid transport system permease protein
MQLASGRAPLIPLPMLATLLVLLSTPLWVGRVGLYQYLALEIMIWVLFAMGYNLLLGFTGLPSFGHGAFFGAGAYAFGLLQLKVWPNLWFDLAGAVLVTAALGGSSRCSSRTGAAFTTRCSPSPSARCSGSSPTNGTP